jgi:hypothetical protein
VYDLCVSEIPDNLPQDSETRQEPQASKSRWESIIWPRWLPTRARLPLMAQILGAIALVAAITMPQWSESPTGNEAELPPHPAAEVATAPAPPAEPARPAHLNLDVRHTFSSVDLSVSVDGARKLDTKVAGGARRFGVLGKRSERGFTKTLDLDPGTRVVRIRVRSNDDEFDQARVERFDLGSASVASLRITADKSGLSVIADRPPAPPEQPRVAAASEAQAGPAPQIRRASNTATAVSSADAGALAELYRTFRQVLMALAGFIASVASGFFVEEYLKSRVNSLSRRSLRG